MMGASDEPPFSDATPFSTGPITPQGLQVVPAIESLSPVAADTPLEPEESLTDSTRPETRPYRVPTDSNPLLLVAGGIGAVVVALLLLSSRHRAETGLPLIPTRSAANAVVPGPSASTVPVRPLQTADNAEREPKRKATDKRSSPAQHVSKLPRPEEEPITLSAEPPLPATSPPVQQQVPVVAFADVSPSPAAVELETLKNKVPPITPETLKNVPGGNGVGSPSIEELQKAYDQLMEGTWPNNEPAARHVLAYAIAMLDPEEYQKDRLQLLFMIRHTLFPQVKKEFLDALKKQKLPAAAKAFPSLVRKK